MKQYICVFVYFMKYFKVFTVLVIVRLSIEIIKDEGCFLLIKHSRFSCNVNTNTCYIWYVIYLSIHLQNSNYDKIAFKNLFATLRKIVLEHQTVGVAFMTFWSLSYIFSRTGFSVPSQAVNLKFQFMKTCRISSILLYLNTYVKSYIYHYIFWFLIWYPTWYVPI